MKKNYLLIAILTFLLSMFGVSNVMAANRISAAEQSILDKLKAGAEINGEMKYVPIAYVNQAENEFISNAVDITDEQAEAIISKIDEAIEIISQMGDVDMVNIQNTEAALKLLTLVGEAANELDYEVTVDLANKSLDVKNPEGDTVFLAKNMVNQTGESGYINVLVSVLVMTALMGCMSFYMLRQSKRHWSDL